MKKVLIINGHSNYENSTANKKILEEIGKSDNVNIRVLSKLYPDFNIDVQAEQEALLGADTIIFQFPIHWFSLPAILKHWFDRVIVSGFAYGEGTAKLKGKQVIISTTTFVPQNVYNDGKKTIDDFLMPLNLTLQYCQVQVEKIVASYAVMEQNTETEAKLEAHIQKLKQYINS